MDRRYLIFISSTFRDLAAERNEVARAILDLGHIPAGMERFPAMDEEQMAYIESVIDDCDYYVLIIGGKYGSVSKKTGLSYTEMEYDYAGKKGLPIIVFEKSPIENNEIDAEIREKFEAFRKRVKSSRLIKSWNDIKDLRAEIALSLPQQIKRKPAIGWVRVNAVASAELTAGQNTLLKERHTLKAENEKLKNALGKNTAIPDIAKIGEFIPLNLIPDIFEENTTWEGLLRFIALETDLMQSAVPELRLEERYKFSSRALRIIRNQFEALGLIITERGSYYVNLYDVGSVYWYLTPNGRKFIRQALVVRTDKTELKKS